MLKCAAKKKERGIFKIKNANATFYNLISSHLHGSTNYF